ncbi:unnamed protein product [Strongylus vulgaris]|uniref:Uncharacterized protein n=1 Tax=Strongylus vulgaris TaxID=40348 RepID=A0A3P7KUF7_STRVU|nr:unnamed protein product [Strongylus vulgaris]
MVWWICCLSRICRILLILPILCRVLWRTLLWSKLPWIRLLRMGKQQGWSS